MAVPYHLRQGAIRTLLESATDPHVQKMLRHAEKMSEKAYDLWQSNPRQYARNFGVISGKDFPPFDFSNIAESLRKQIGVAQRTEDLTGWTKGFVSDEVAGQFAKMFESRSPEQQLILAGEVSKGLGDRASAFYDQLRDHGLKGAYAFAGVAVQGGDFVAGQALLLGAERLKDKNVNWIKSGLGSDLNLYIIEKLNRAYPESEERRSLAAHAFRAAYVALMEMTNIEDDKIDETMANRAFDIATGGLVEWGDSVVQPAFRYFGQDKWEDHIKSLHPSELIAMNDGAVPINYTIERLMKLIKNKKIAFIDRNPLSGKDGYLMVNKADGKRILSSSGKEYIFKYRNNPITVKGVRDKQMAVAVAESKITIHDWGYSSTQLMGIVTRFKNLAKPKYEEHREGKH